MPILKNAKKALRNQNRKKGYNKAWKSRLKKVSDELNKKLRNSDKDSNSLFSTYQKIVDKAVSKKIIHKNKANRLKSNVYKRIQNVG